MERRLHPHRGGGRREGAVGGGPDLGHGLQDRGGGRALEADQLDLVPVAAAVPGGDRERGHARQLPRGAAVQVPGVAVGPHELCELCAVLARRGVGRIWGLRLEALPLRGQGGHPRAGVREAGGHLRQHLGRGLGGGLGARRHRRRGPHAPRLGPRGGQADLRRHRGQGVGRHAGGRGMAQTRADRLRLPRRSRPAVGRVSRGPAAGNRSEWDAGAAHLPRARRGGRGPRVRGQRRVRRHRGAGAAAAAREEGQGRAARGGALERLHGSGRGVGDRPGQQGFAAVAGDRRVGRGSHRREGVCRGGCVAERR
mmetsp:Transcript_75805/g.214322  ORF Transcript_75805/g.214322 Transcript_75805/m.214322 type:complete len:311 (-) Transcript_75805:691-1623(-)